MFTQPSMHAHVPAGSFANSSALPAHDQDCIPALKSQNMLVYMPGTQTQSFLHTDAFQSIMLASAT
jgi:hypothetical protein